MHDRLHEMTARAVDNLGKILDEPNASPAWRSADRGETWRRIQGFNFKWGHRVIPDPVDRARIYITTCGGGVWHGPAEGDPGSVEDIEK